MDLVQVFLLIIGLAMIVVGVLYKKKDHKKFEKGAPFGGDLSEALLALILYVLPWYILKTFFILFGLFIVIGVLFFY